MRRATSIYLDLLRCLAAMGVFLGHTSSRWFAGDHGRFPSIGHELVIVFFVLSGYVIADATVGKSRPAVAYVAGRLSRLGSVAIPAVVLTALLWRIGMAIAPEFYAEFTRPHEHVREILSAAFCQELWFFSACPPSNEPLWSLSYEFWYYVIFGCWVYARTPRQRFLLVAGSAVLAGPKILLLFPIWLLGLLAWRLRNSAWCRSPVARVGFALSLAAVVVIIRLHWAYPHSMAMPPWFYSGRFVSDWFLGLLLAGNIVCFDRGFGQWAISSAIERPIRAVADMTFSLYAYHFALLVFFAAAIPYDRSNRIQVTGVLLLAIAVIAVLQQMTEAQRPRLRRLIERWLGAWFGRRASAAALQASVCSDLPR